MGTKTNSGTPSVLWSASAAALACAGLLASDATASNWITPAGGAWTDPANWSPAIPDGVDAVADFSTIDLTADATVTLGTAHTVGTLNFGDTDVATAAGWLLSDGTQQTLTLSATNGMPIINVGNLGAGKAATIASLLSVATGQVVAKTGVGTLIFTNTGNATATTFAGILEIQQGTFQVGNTAALPNFDPATVRLNGGTMRFSAAASTGRIFTLGQNGGTLAFAVGSTFNGTAAMQFVGSGSRTLTVNAESGTTSITSPIGDGSGGATSLVKAGTGAITLVGANTFTGTIAVNAGTLTGTHLGGTAVNATTYTGGGVTIAAGATAAINRTTALNFAGPISGAGNFAANVTNDGVISLANATYTGTTTVQRGTFNYSNAPSTSNYVLGNTAAPTGYGIINLDNGDFTAPLGTTGGGVTWAASGGFANPTAGTRVVALGGTASPTPLQLNVNGFVAGNGTSPATDFRLAFGSIDGTSAGQVDFRNSIDLNGRRLTVLANGTAVAPGILSGNITGTGLAAGGLFKFGNASLLLTGTNSYTGPTSIVAGLAPNFAGAIILGSAGAFSPNTNMQLNGGSSGLTGGVLGLGFADGNFTLGTGNGQVQFVAANSGGFGAYGANRTVTLNSGAPLVWASTAGFLAASQNLVLALQNSDATLTFNNPLDVNGSNRGIVVNNGSAAIDAVIAQPIINSSATVAGINKLGSGTLSLTAANTYSGVTTVTGGTLILSGNGTFGGGQISNSGAIVISKSNALAVPSAIIGSGTFTQAGSGTTTLTGSQTYTGQTIVTAGTLRTTSQNVLTNAGGLDVQNGSFVLDYTGNPSPAATVRNLLANSFIAGAGVMNTGQIKSTTATAARGLGYRDDGTGTVLIKAALFGDADLDGGVSINDFNTLAGNFGASSGKVWVDGDFDYDGGVSINDFNLLAGGFGQSLPPTSEAWAGLLAFAAAHDDLAAFAAITGVPEPTSFGLLAAGATLGLRRRCRVDA